MSLRQAGRVFYSGSKLHPLLLGRLKRLSASQHLSSGKQSRQLSRCALIRTYTLSCVHSRHYGGTGTTATALDERTGLFDIPEFSGATGFAFETKKCVERSKRLVEKIKSLADGPDASIIDLMDQLSDELCRVADLSECIRQVHPDDEASLAAQQACLAINSYVEELNTDTGLYRALRNLMDSDQYENLDKVTKRTAEVFMHDFEISGIHLKEPVRKELVKKNDYLLEVGYAFALNTSHPTLVHKDDCSQALMSYYPEKDGYIHISDIPYTDPDPRVRESGYRSYYAQDEHKMKALEDVILSRLTIAQVTGYPSFADRQLKMSMAESPEVVVDFLQSLSEKILPLAGDDVCTMKRIRKDHSKLFGNCSDIQPWDVPLIISKARSLFLPSVVRDSTTSVKNWFSLDSCLGGLGSLFKSLFGVSLEVVPVKRGEVWHPSVIKFAFVDDGGHLLGHTYGDLMYREGKLASDCHFTIRGGREVTESGRANYQLPVITLCCSTEDLSEKSSILLSRHCVETLFHEMGHALHSMLGRARYQNITGTRCSTDFAEVPSTLMEFFLGDGRVLASFAKHHVTGEPLPPDLTRHFQLSGHLFAAYEMQVQICNAIVDQRFHSSAVSVAETGGWIMDTYRGISDRYSPLGYVPDTAYFLRFPHLGSYGARYYSYLWSRAVASLIWKSSFERDPFSRAAGEKFRAMLSFGGGINPKELVRDMLGFEPSVEQLVNALHSDVLKHRQQLDVYRI